MADAVGMSGINPIGSHAQLMQEVGMKVASKAMDIARQQGAAQQELLDKAVEVQQQTQAGPGHDTGQAASAGGRLDVTG